MIPIANITFPTAKKKRLIVASVFAILSAMLLTLIYFQVQSHTGIAYLDRPILQWAVDNRMEPFVTIMQIITNVMGPETLMFLTVLLGALWTWRKKEYWRPSLFAVAIFLTLGVSSLLKVLVSRPRPPTTTMIHPLETGFSFPSIHTVGITAAALIIGYFLYTRSANTLLMIIWAILSALSIILIATSRIYLGYHWLTDVIASILVGLIILALVITIDTYSMNFRPRT